MGRSRMIYLRKLLETFPEDDWRGTYYARDLLAPRFFPSLLKEYRDAARLGDTPALQTAVDDIKVLIPYLPRRSRALIRAALPLMAHNRTAELAARLADWELPLIRRLLRLALPGQTPGTNRLLSKSNQALHQEQ
jgi:hypothetical protein